MISDTFIYVFVITKHFSKNGLGNTLINYLINVNKIYTGGYILITLIVLIGVPHTIKPGR